MAVVSYEMDQSIAPKSSDLSIQKVREIKAKRKNVKTQEVEYLVEWENKSLEQGQGGNGSAEQQSHKQMHGEHHQAGQASALGPDAERKLAKLPGGFPAAGQ